MTSKSRFISSLLILLAFIFGPITLLRDTSVGLLANRITLALDTNFQTMPITYMLLACLVLTVITLIGGFLTTKIIDSSKSLEIVELFKSIKEIATVYSIALLLCESIMGGTSDQHYVIAAFTAAITYFTPEPPIKEYDEFKDWMGQKLSADGAVSFVDVHDNSTFAHFFPN